MRGYAELRSIVRSHVIAWRKDMESRKLKPAFIRHKLLALSSLFDYLCEHNAVAGNPVDGVKRPMTNGNEGSTPRDVEGALSRPVRNNRTGHLDRPLDPGSVYRNIVRKYGP